MAPSRKQLVFKVHRREPQLIPPAKPTPHEVKPLSDIDDQEGLRTHIPLIHFYSHEPSTQGKDPVGVIREALAKTLVFYYPFAGRLREWPNRKLVVECTGEGILFIEADAEVSLEEFGDLQPPFPCLEELLFDVPGSGGITDCPLLLIQVTRLKCGGFIFSTRLNHTMSDAAGISQFLVAVGEMALGAHAPSILPLWERHILSARDPPRITCMHHEYDHLTEPEPIDKVADGTSDTDHRSFFFGLDKINHFRRLFSPPHFGKLTNFEALTACLWKCRTIALQPDPNAQMRILCIVNARHRFVPPLPKGYYGNCIAYSVATATAGELSQNPVGYALELIREAKENVTEEYMKSLADLMVIKGRPKFSLVRSYLVSDGTRAKLREVDFGWGQAAYGAPAKGNVASFQISHRNKRGEEGTLVTLCLPAPAMERFVKELDKLLLEEHPSGGDIRPRMSSL